MAVVADGIDRRRFAARLPVPVPRDELRRLAVAFNALIDRLSDAVHAQRRFMADASHELRTPVTVARTAAQVTLSGATRTEPEYREALGIVSLQMERLAHVVDDMFLLARAEAHSRPLEATAIYLDELVGECTRAVRVLADARGVEVRTNGAREVTLVGDENLLRQLVTNLLENAVSHTPPGGNVSVELGADNGNVAVAVTDSGPGVPREDRDRIFERFVRLMVQRELRPNVHRPACEIIRMHLDHRPARRDSHIGVDLDFVEILSVGQRRGRQREHEDHNCKRSTDGPVHRAEIPDRCLRHATPYAIRDPLIDGVGARGMSYVATTCRDRSPKVVAWC